ncbi:hypothetical protein HPB49_002778 [Dermacentor silvarum]|uniref:Uncharacterized protein n=1 Tax=Dermacentor silvarum TaxID=543639 RepID=A0ACB8DAK2_DERSI|nr:hypothetical protein HPB49_002778 [Dermacentor silvarum]
MVSEELRHTFVAHHNQGMTIPEIAKRLKLRRVQIHCVVKLFQATVWRRQTVSGDRQGPAVKRDALNGNNPGAEIGRQQGNQGKFAEKHEKTHPRARSQQLDHATTRERGKARGVQISERAAAGPNEDLQAGKMPQDEAAEL